MIHFFWTICGIFAIIGLCQCLDWLLHLRLKPKEIPCCYYVILLHDDPAGIEAQLRYGVSRLRWGSAGGQIALLVNMGLSEQSIAVCSRFMRDYPGLICCEPDRLVEALKDLDELQRR